jgi:hypothetical protein
MPARSSPTGSPRPAPISAVIVLSRRTMRRICPRVIAGRAIARETLTNAW